jgi:hypothetical protein
MIRFLGGSLRTILGLGLLAWTVWLLWPTLKSAWQSFDSRGQSNPALSRLEKATPGIAYRLDKDHWLEFPVSGQDHRFKVISNANLKADVAAQPETEWPYALRYQLMSGEGQVLQEGIYSHRTAVTWYQLPNNPQPVTAAFYPDQQLVPADGRLLMIDASALRGVASLRLQLAESSPGIESVMARAYGREHLFDPPGSYRWQRVVRRQRENLAQASVYGPDLLRNSEQTQLLRQRWSPLGPLGIEGRDYQRLRFYQALDIEIEPLRTPILPAGLAIDADLRATLPIPDPGGWIALEFLQPDQSAITPIVNQTPAVLPTIVDVHWYGNQPKEQASHHVTLNDALTSTLWVMKAGGGLLEVVAPRPLILKATYYQRTGPPLDLVPDPRYLRLYRLEPEQPLEFAITHADNQPTFWRVDLRQPGLDQHTTAITHYQFLDNRGQIVHQGNLALSGVLSNYDRLSGGPTPIERVSEPTTYGFALPTTVTRVRLTASAPVLANGYTRPPDLRRELQVPEDYRFADRAAAPRQPVWFPVLPLAASRWVQEGRTALLAIQSRPPQRDPEILAGKYDWQEYYPLGDWRGRYLLNPRDPENPMREQALAVTFQPLATGGPRPINLQGPPGRLRVEPALLGLRDSDQPEPVRISIDGQIAYAGVLTLRRNHLQLPPLSPGPHTLHLETSRPTRWFMNYSGNATGSLIRRFAYRLDRQPLAFEYVKTSPALEVLSGLLQTPANPGGRFRLRATVEMPNKAILGPFQRLTLREWLYDIQSETVDPVPVFDTPSDYVGLGQRFFLPLGDDAPPGTYRIRLWLEQGSGYLTLYRVTPGLPMGLEFFIEDTQP